MMGPILLSYENGEHLHTKSSICHSHVRSFSCYFQGISKVVMFKRIGYYDRTLEVETRVSYSGLNTKRGATQYSWMTAGTVCGQRSGTASVKVETFRCSPPLDGTHVTMQTYSTVSMNIAELDIFVTGAVALRLLSPLSWPQATV